MVARGLANGHAAEIDAGAVEDFDVRWTDLGAALQWDFDVVSLRVVGAQVQGADFVAFVLRAEDYAQFESFGGGDGRRKERAGEGEGCAVDQRALDVQGGLALVEEGDTAYGALAEFDGFEVDADLG